MKKGLALEMIVTLIMLLVVAAVIIGFFLGIFTGKPPFQQSEELVKKENFIRQCDQLCNNIGSDREAVEFCEKSDSVDWNGDGAKDQAEMLSVPPRAYACENRIYCFQAYNCNKLRLRQNERFQVEACRRVSCESFIEIAANPQDADRLFLSRITTGEEERGFQCSLDFPDWHDRFISQTPCSNPPAG